MNLAYIKAIAWEHGSDILEFIKQSDEL